MSNKTDKLFKEKLAEHALPPSAQAWEKIEAGLSKKNKAILWFRVAAVLALMALLTFALLQWNYNETTTTTPSLAQQTDSAQQKKEITPLAAEEEKKPEQVNPLSSSPKTIVPVVKKKAEQQPIALQEEQMIRPQEEVKVDEIKQEPIVVNTTTASVAKKSMKITFHLPSIESKNERKEEVAVAAVEPVAEKKNTLQRAFDEIRTADVLGTIREAKDNLFALEFKKDKSKKPQ